MKLATTYSRIDSFIMAVFRLGWSLNGQNAK